MQKSPEVDLVFGVKLKEVAAIGLFLHFILLLHVEVAFIPLARISFLLQDRCARTLFGKCEGVRP